MTIAVFNMSSSRVDNIIYYINQAYNDFAENRRQRKKLWENYKFSCKELKS